MNEDRVSEEGREMVDEGYLQPSRYRITYRCPRCEHVWARTFKAPPKRDPPCPNRECVAIQRTATLQQEVANLRKMLEEQRAPAHIGANVAVKAVDLTAEITMKDNNMTNLNDSMRPGDIAAPKLPPKMQSAANEFFSAKHQTVLGNPKQKVSSAFLDKMGRRAIAGAFRDTAVAPNQVMPKSRLTPNIVGDYDPRRR